MSVCTASRRAYHAASRFCADAAEGSLSRRVAVRLSNGMQRVKWLRRAFPILCLFAAVGPAFNVIRLLRAREFAKTVTTYGPLPEIPVPALEYFLLGLSVLVLIAGLLELMKFRAAPRIALAGTVAMWFYFGPALWAHLKGDGFFEPGPGLATSVPWQQFAWLTAAMVCSAYLTWIRLRTP
jgi:hypothetical protein